jgi:hypothetical protein
VQEQSKNRDEPIKHTGRDPYRTVYKAHRDKPMHLSGMQIRNNGKGKGTAAGKVTIMARFCTIFITILISFFVIASRANGRVMSESFKKECKLTFSQLIYDRKRSFRQKKSDTSVILSLFS